MGRESFTLTMDDLSTCSSLRILRAPEPGESLVRWRNEAPIRGAHGLRIAIPGAATDHFGSTR